MTDAVLATSSIRTTARRRSPFRRKAFPYLLVAPAVIYLLGITLWPGIYAINRSLQTGKFKLEWVGLQNYRELLVDNAFWTAIWNTLFLGSITLAIEFVIAMGLAALVYRSGWARGWRIVFMLPDAVHAIGRFLSVEAAVQRWPRHRRPASTASASMSATSTGWATCSTPASCWW